MTSTEHLTTQSDTERTHSYEREFHSRGEQFLGEQSVDRTVVVADLHPHAETESMSDIETRNKERVERAIADCEVEPTHEVQEAIADYYDDHEKLIHILNQVFEGAQIDTAAIIDSENGIKAEGLKYKLMRFIDKRDDPNKHAPSYLLSEVLRTVYGECAVGATTIGEDEYRKVFELREVAERYRQHELQNTGHHLDLPYSEIESAGKREKETFWKDARQAGQLLFHNTSFGSETVEAGFKLATRKHQKKTTGDYVATTGDIAGHSEVVHFSEVFDTDGYKEVQANGRKGKEKLRVPVTIGVPISEIIKTTPYARGGQYGEVQLRQDSSREVAIHSDVIASTSNWFPNNGSDDSTPNASGLDRVFYADNVDRDDGENYAYQLDHTAHYIRLQRDLDNFDRRTILGQNGMEHVGKFLSGDLIVHGAGQGYPASHVIDFDYSGYGGSMTPGSQPGEKFINERMQSTLRNGGYLGDMADYRLSDPRFHRVANEHHSYTGKTKEENDALLRAEVARLQQESCGAPQFKDKFVVLLRGNDTAFETRG